MSRPGEPPRIDSDLPSRRRTLAIRLGIPTLLVVTLGVVGGVVTHNSALIVGALIAAALTVAVYGVEVPLILGLQRRRATDRLSSAPAGTLFVETATLITDHTDPPAGTPAASTRRIKGNLRIGSLGVDFKEWDERLGGPLTEVSVPWAGVAETSVKTVTPQLADLTVVTHSGRRLTWRTQGPYRLSEALGQLNPPT